MNENHAFIEKGARAFGFWAGVTDIVSNPATLITNVSESIRTKFENIAQKLYRPPDENLQAPAHEYLHTPVDDLFLEIAGEVDIEHSPFWLDHAPYAVCLTHDIDRIRSTYQMAAMKFRKRDLRGAVKTFVSDMSSETNPFDNFERIAHFEKEWGIRSALYVLFERKRFMRALFNAEIQHVLGVYDPEAIGDALRNMKSQGFEIGLHGSFDAHSDRHSLSSEGHRLAQLLDADPLPCGVRNHYLQFDIDRTPSIQKECGFAYDSTLGFNFTCGFRCATVFPFILVYDNKQSLLELSMNVMDTALRFSAPDHEAEAAERIAEIIRRNGGLLMINWHQHFCNPEIAPAMYTWVEKTIKQAREDNAYIATPMEITTYWLKRI